MKLTLSAAGGPLAEIDLGQPEVMGPRDTIAYLESGDLGGTFGNLYLAIDGKEHGSLFFHVDREDRLVIELGQFSDDTGEWEPRNPILVPVGASLTQKEA